VSCGVGRRCGLDPALLWLWCRPEATAPIRPLAWESPYAAGAALEKVKEKKKKKKRFLETPEISNPRFFLRWVIRLNGAKKEPYFTVLLLIHKT